MLLLHGCTGLLGARAVSSEGGDGYPLGYPLPCSVPSLGSLPGSPRTRCRDLPVLIQVLPHASSLRAFEATPVGAAGVKPPALLTGPHVRRDRHRTGCSRNSTGAWGHPQRGTSSAGEDPRKNTWQHEPELCFQPQAAFILQTQTQACIRPRSGLCGLSLVQKKSEVKALPRSMHVGSLSDSHKPPTQALRNQVKDN